MLQTEVLSLPQNVNRHKHDHFQLVLGLTGTAEIDMHGLAAHLDVSHACIVPSDTYHDFFGRPSNHVLVVNLDHRASAFHDPRHPDYEILNPLFETPRLVSLDSGMRQLTQVCIQEIQRSQTDLGLRNDLASAIIRCLSHRLHASKKPVKVGLLDLHRIDQYINTHLHGRISITAMADCICMSERHFHTLFKRQTRMTPHQYIIRMRLNFASKLLTETNLPLVQVSQKCGFSSQSALTNCMRKHEGTTPLNLRNKAHISR